MKKTLLLALPIILLAACGTPKEEGRYYHPEKDFSIELPSDWETQEGFMGTDLVGISKLTGTNDTFAENITLIAVDLLAIMDLTIDQYFDMNMSATGAVLQNYELIESGLTTIAEVEAKWGQYTYEMSGVKVKALAFLFMHEEMGYMINFASTAEEFIDYLALFEEIAHTFRIES
jgi:hypothetical protein